MPKRLILHLWSFQVCSFWVQNQKALSILRCGKYHSLKWCAQDWNSKLIICLRTHKFWESPQRSSSSFTCEAKHPHSTSRGAELKRTWHLHSVCVRSLYWLHCELWVFLIAAETNLCDLFFVLFFSPQKQCSLSALRPLGDAKQC